MPLAEQMVPFLMSSLIDKFKIQLQVCSHIPMLCSHGTNSSMYWCAISRFQSAQATGIVAKLFDLEHNAAISTPTGFSQSIHNSQSLGVSFRKKTRLSSYRSFALPFLLFPSLPSLLCSSYQASSPNFSQKYT